MSAVLTAFEQRARTHPERLALVITRPGDGCVVEQATYSELHARVMSVAAGLRREGFAPGDRLVLAAPLSLDFYALALAAVASRMVVVLIDGRLDRRRLLSALRTAHPRGIVSVPEALRRWPAVPPLWRARRYAAGGGFGVRPLESLAAPAGSDGGEPDLSAGAADEPAIISFTSGSTGRAKGVVRTNGILDAQHLALSRHLPYADGDVDMTSLPAVVLHNLGSGVTTVLPPVDLRAPGTVDPAIAICVMRRFGVTTLSGAPAFVSRVARAAGSDGGVDSLRLVVVGGAPVPPALCAGLIEGFGPAAEVVVVYGSTEAEPISHVAGAQLVDEGPAGEGLLVGPPVDEVEVALVELPERLPDRVAPGWLAAAAVPPGMPGEVVVRGPGVSREYVGDVEAVARNKVRVSDGSVWHRTGDIARLDGAGRLWLLGRVADAVALPGGGVAHPLPVEAALQALPGVERAALVATAAGPVVALQGAAPAHDVSAVLAGAGLAGIPVRAVDAIPVDARHQSKVDRGALRELLRAEHDNRRSGRDR